MHSLLHVAEEQPNQPGSSNQPEAAAESSFLEDMEQPGSSNQPEAAGSAESSLSEAKEYVEEVIFIVNYNILSYITSCIYLTLWALAHFDISI